MIEEFLLLLWGGWVTVHLVLFGMGVVFIRPLNTAHFNGFTIIIPRRVSFWLMPEELQAVVEHEEGHRRHFHVWYNLLRCCLLVPVSREEIWQQELQCDDGVHDPAALARALRKLGCNGFDLFRAERLERRAQGRQDAVNLTPGMGA